MATLSLRAILGMDGSGFFRTAKQAEGAVKSLSNQFNGNLKGAIAGAFGVGALLYYEKKVIEFASHINDLSDRVGVSTDALQEWSYAAKQNGSDIDDVVGFFEKLGQARQKALGNNQESIASFKKLGITLDDLKKKRLEDIGIGVGRTVMNGDPQSLGASLRDVGGRGATRLITTFKGDVEQLSKAAREAGAVIKNDTIQQLDDLGDALDNFKTILMGPMATGLLFVVDGLKMMATGVKAISVYLGAKASEWMNNARGNAAQNAGGGMAFNSGTARTNKDPEMYSTSAGLKTNNDPAYQAFLKVFSDAAEQEEKARQDRAIKRASRNSGIPTELGVGKSEKMSVTAREQIGAYIGGANPLLQVAQRSEKHLEAIKKALLQKNVGGFDGPNGDIYA